MAKELANYYDKSRRQQVVVLRDNHDVIETLLIGIADLANAPALITAKMAAMDALTDQIDASLVAQKTGAAIS